jgi:hypothetical protein
MELNKALVFLLSRVKISLHDWFLISLIMLVDIDYDEVNFPLYAFSLLLLYSIWHEYPHFAFTHQVGVSITWHEHFFKEIWHRHPR